MYQCQKCNQFSKPGEALNRIVVQTRNVSYENKVRRKDENDKVTVETISSSGSEIVEEMNVCGECAPLPIARPYQFHWPVEPKKVIGTLGEKLMSTYNAE